MNCKPGDLAIIIKAMIPENVGKIVRVVEFFRNDERFGPLWTVECESIHNAVGLEYLQPRARSHLPLHGPDDWMRPVSGLPVHDEQRDEVPA